MFYGFLSCPVLNPNLYWDFDNLIGAYFATHYSGLDGFILVLEALGLIFFSVRDDYLPPNSPITVDVKSSFIISISIYIMIKRSIALVIHVYTQN